MAPNRQHPIIWSKVGPMQWCHRASQSHNQFINMMIFILNLTPGPWFNIKMSSYQYRKSHCGYKTIVRSSYLHNGISYTGKMISFDWIGPLASIYCTKTTARRETNIQVLGFGVAYIRDLTVCNMQVKNITQWTLQGLLRCCLVIFQIIPIHLKSRSIAIRVCLYIKGILQKGPSICHA